MNLEESHPKTESDSCLHIVSDINTDPYIAKIEASMNCAAVLDIDGVGKDN